jgi:putative membrane protein
MWNCNWGTPFFHYGIVGIMVNILMLVTIIYIVILAARSFFAKNKPVSDTNDSLEIIKQKFARGEISEEEYRRMQEILAG